MCHLRLLTCTNILHSFDYTCPSIYYKQILPSKRNLTTKFESCKLKWSFKTVSIKAWATVAAVYGWLRAIKWAALISQLTTTKITDFPNDLGMSSMKSIEISDQIDVGIGKGWINPGGATVSCLQVEKLWI